jgi:uncharacterized membrane protein
MKTLAETAWGLLLLYLCLKFGPAATFVTLSSLGILLVIVWPLAWTSDPESRL